MFEQVVRFVRRNWILVTMETERVNMEDFETDYSSNFSWP